MIRHKGFVVAAVVSAALMSGAWFLQRETEPAGSVYQQARLFDDVLAHVADYYVDSLDEKQLYQMAIDGMLDKLGDPYSRSEEHTSELQSQSNLVCRLLLEKKKII